MVNSGNFDLQEILTDEVLQINDKELEKCFEEEIWPQLEGLQNPTQDKVAMIFLSTEWFTNAITNFLSSHPDIPLVLITALFVQRIFSRLANTAHHKFDKMVDTKQNNINLVIRKSIVWTWIITTCWFVLYYYWKDERIYDNISYLQPLRDVTKKFEIKDWVRWLLSWWVWSVIMNIAKIKRKVIRRPIRIAVLWSTMYVTQNLGSPIKVVASPEYLKYIPFVNREPVIENTETIEITDIPGVGNTTWDQEIEQHYYILDDEHISLLESIKDVEFAQDENVKITKKTSWNSISIYINFGDWLFFEVKHEIWNPQTWEILDAHWKPLSSEDNNKILEWLLSRSN